MNRLDLAEYRSRASEHAAAVAGTPGVCGFCSRPLWQLAAHDHLHGLEEETPRLIVEREGTWLVAAQPETAGLFFPFEAAWMFGCPLAGEPAAAAELLLDLGKTGSRAGGMPALFIGGLVRDGEMHRALRSLGPYARVLREYPGTEVMLIDLEGDAEAWLSRRSKKFRRTLRGAANPLPGLEIVDASNDDPQLSFGRILEIQRHSYKWEEGTDIFQIPAYEAFYRAVFHGLHAEGGLRLLFASRDGVDLAHIFGGVAGSIYRGLQMSYREEARSLALGNRLQWENLSLRAAEGIITYDLGMFSPYKERWVDRREERIGMLWAG